MIFIQGSPELTQVGGVDTGRLSGIVSPFQIDNNNEAMLRRSRDAARERGLAWTTHAAQPNGLFGISMAALNDIDGDGVGDLAVGAPAESGQSGLFIYRGQIHLLSGATGSTIWVDQWFDALNQGIAFDYGISIMRHLFLALCLCGSGGRVIARQPCQGKCCHVGDQQQHTIDCQSI